MSPTIHSTGGHSFVGCINYLLHGAAMPANDVAKPSSRNQYDERVAWTETGNLGTKNPETAAKVMAAYAMKADELKAAAGVSRRGTPTTKGSVMHYTLSWRSDEIEGGPSKQEMLRATYASLKVLGKDTTKGKKVPKDGGRRQFADEHQYVIVAHTDKQHPHVHVVVNMTNHEHGRRLPTSNDQNKLQSWALKYEKENNKILCPKRVENRKARRWNEKEQRYEHFVKAEERLNRKDYDRQQAIRESQSKTELQKKQNQQFEKLKKAAHQQKKDHARQLDALRSLYLERQATARDQAKTDYRSAKKSILEEARLGLAKLLNERDAEQVAYKQREETGIGRLQNTWAALKHKGWEVLNTRQDRSLFSSAFKAMFELHADPKARFRHIEARCDQQEREHHKQVDSDLAAARQKINAEREAALQVARQKYQQQRKDLLFKQGLEQAKTNATWHNFRENNKKQWQDLRNAHAAEPQQQQTQAVEPTKPEDLLPQQGSEQAAQIIDSRREQMANSLRQEQTQQPSDQQQDGGRNV